jgi:putative ABC transport system ATP-binding protein
MPDVPVLVGRRLTRAYGRGALQTLALRDVSLDLYPGRLCLLMGPSGGGKSTLLSVLSGLLRPDGGTVTALGQDLWGLSERERERFRLRHFGFVFQGCHLLPALTVRQQLELVLRWGEGLSGPAAAARIGEVLESLGVAGKAALRPAQLSGGEKQRVAIARALIKNPAVCFADEPTSALDWANGQQVVKMLREAGVRRRAALLVVTHDARLVPLADQVVHLEDGHWSDASNVEHAGAGLERNVT